MKTVYKYALQAGGIQRISMPTGAVLLCVQVQCETPCVWAYVDDSNACETRRLRVYGTGHEVDEGGTYVGTFQISGGSLVFHVFDMGGDRG